MSDDALLDRIRALEADNARLRRLLEAGGSTSGFRHHVRNTLAMVRDVVRRSAERFEGVEDFTAHLEGRLDAVMRIQNAIAYHPFDSIRLDLLIADELLAHSAREGGQVSIDGPEVALKPVVAGALALAIHELAINAVKFGALSREAGRIAVDWSVSPGKDGSPWLTLRWVESGIAIGPPGPPGFGSDVVERALRYQFGGEGTLDFAPGGLRCTLRLPLTPWVSGMGGPTPPPAA